MTDQSNCICNDFTHQEQCKCFRKECLNVVLRPLIGAERVSNCHLHRDSSQSIPDYGMYWSIMCQDCNKEGWKVTFGGGTAQFISVT